MKYYIRLYLFIIVLLFIRQQIFSQNNRDFNIKETYDYFSETQNIINFDIVKFMRPNDNYGSALGDGAWYNIISLIKMYNLTKDKAYIYKLISFTYKFQTIRFDRSDTSMHPGWSNISCDKKRYRNLWGLIYHEGNILWSMSEFVYNVKNDTNLYNTPILNKYVLKLDIYENMYPVGYNTVGEYVEWLSGEIKYSLDWYIDNNYYSKTHNSITQCPEYKDEPIGMNMQMGLGNALLFYGLAYKNDFYLSKGISIAKHFLDTVKFYDKCHDIYYNKPLLIKQTVGNDTAYWWQGDGWRIPFEYCSFKYPNCLVYCDRQPSYEAYTNLTEDISHAIQDIYLMFNTYKYYSQTYPFDASSMKYLKNTFTKLIYDKGIIHKSVKGTDWDISEQVRKEDFTLRSLCWTWLSMFDEKDNQPTVYDIGMILFKKNIFQNKNTIEKNMDDAELLGLAELTVVQWERENVNLTLYKRKLVYNQNFSAPQKLSIEPSSDNFLNSYVSFAYPLISNKEFIVESGVSVKLKAGNKIHLAPGFHAKSGCSLSASIDKSLIK